MFDSATDTDVRDDAYGGRSLVAIFDAPARAREAARQLLAEAFHHVWIGVTHRANDGAMPATAGFRAASGTASGDPMERMTARASGATGATGASGTDGLVVESEDESLGAKLGRFFSGEGTTATRSLFDELVRHGVDRTSAARLEREIPPESAVLTVDGANHPEHAAYVIEACGGHLVAGEAFEASGNDPIEAAGASGAGTTTERRGSDVLGYRDPQRYARGSEIDDERRLQLRSERLEVAKRREAAGEATVGKEVVERRQELDVPTFHEELFVERRGAAEAGATGADAAPIGASETIRIPLMRERVVVTKRPVVTGEYVVGKRQVGETQHVSETLREEKLRVDDPNAIATGAADTTAARAADPNDPNGISNR